MRVLLAAYKDSLSVTFTKRLRYVHEYVEGGTNAYSLNADTFFSIVMQLDDLIDFIACRRVCRAWCGALSETRLWKGAVMNFAYEGRTAVQRANMPKHDVQVLENRVEGLGRKYAGDWQALFFAQLDLWGKPQQSNSNSTSLVLAVERMHVDNVRKCMENGTDPTFPAGQSSHGNIRTPLECWYKATTQHPKNVGYHLGGKLFVSLPYGEVLELLITRGGLDIFRYSLPARKEIPLGRSQFDWKNAQFESGRTLEELQAMIENYITVPYSLRGWRLYSNASRRGNHLRFNIK